MDSPARVVVNINKSFSVVQVSDRNDRRHHIKTLNVKEVVDVAEKHSEGFVVDFHSEVVLWSISALSEGSRVSRDVAYAMTMTV